MEPNIKSNEETKNKLEMWASAERDGRPAEYRWHPLFNAAVNTDLQCAVWHKLCGLVVQWLGIGL